MAQLNTLQSQHKDVDLPFVNPNYGPMLGLAVTATALAALALFSKREAARIIGTTVLTGVGYGITNDMVACRECIQYFTIGHAFNGERIINTLDPNANAVVWGMVATWHVCAIAGALFALLARCPFSFLTQKVTVKQLAPIIAVGAISVFLISHALSRSAKAQMEKHPIIRYKDVPQKYQAGWEANNVRNLTGYLMLLFGGAVLSVAIVAMRAGVFRR